MGQKRITALQLRDNVTDDCNFGVDDGIQGYRVTALQLLAYILPNNRIVSDMINAAAVITAKIQDAAVTTIKIADGAVTRAKIEAAERIPTGAIQPFAGQSTPTGWLWCDGSAISRTTYSALFAVIGTTFGSGDGSTTFNVPNTNGIFLRGGGAQTIGGITYSSSIGTYQNDMFQGHFHIVKNNPGGSTVTTSGSAGSNTDNLATGLTNSGLLVEATDLKTNGTNGTPRSGNETRPASVGVNFMIKF